MAAHSGREAHVVQAFAALLLLIFAQLAGAARPPKLTCTEEIKIWDLETMQEQATLHKQGPAESSNLRPFTSLAFSRDGKLLLATGSLTKVWDLRTGKELPSEDMPHGWPTFLQDGRTVAFCDHSSVIFWDLQTRQKRTTVLPGALGNIHASMITPDGRLVVGSAHVRVPGEPRQRLKPMVWDAATGKSKDGFEDSEEVCGVRGSPDGKLLATVSARFPPLWPRQPPVMTMKLWDVQTGRVLNTFPSSEPLVFFPDSKTLITAEDMNEDRICNLFLLDIPSGRKRVLIHQFPLTLLAHSPDARLLAGCERRGGPGSIALWDVATGRQLATLGAPGLQVGTLAFSPDSKKLATITGEIHSEYPRARSLPATLPNLGIAPAKLGTFLLSVGAVSAVLLVTAWWLARIYRRP